MQIIYRTLKCFRPLSGMLVSNYTRAEAQEAAEKYSFRPLSGMLVSNVMKNIVMPMEEVSVPCRGCWFQIALELDYAIKKAGLFPSPVGDVGFKLSLLLTTSL